MWSLCPDCFWCFFCIATNKFSKNPTRVNKVQCTAVSILNHPLLYFGYPDMIHVGTTTTTADNYFSYLKRLCHSTWTENICHAVGSGLTIIRPVQWLCQFQVERDLEEQRLDLSL